jgi:hypothetical protein
VPTRGLEIKPGAQTVKFFLRIREPPPKAASNNLPVKTQQAASREARRSKFETRRKFEARSWDRRDTARPSAATEDDSRKRTHRTQRGREELGLGPQVGEGGAPYSTVPGLGWCLDGVPYVRTDSHPRLFTLNPFGVPFGVARGRRLGTPCPKRQSIARSPNASRPPRVLRQQNLAGTARFFAITIQRSLPPQHLWQTNFHLGRSQLCSRVA